VGFLTGVSESDEVLEKWDLTLVDLVCEENMGRPPRLLECMLPIKFPKFRSARLRPSVTAFYTEENHISRKDKITFIYNAFTARGSGTGGAGSRDSGTLGGRVVATLCSRTRL